MFKRSVMILIVIGLLIMISNVWAQNLSLEMVSVSSEGVEGNYNSGFDFNSIDISDDGRFVVFSSTASNLVEGDTNNGYDVFVHDRETGITERVSVSSSGQQSTGLTHADTNNIRLAISHDGRFVVFSSSASNLIDNPQHPTANDFLRKNIYLRDRLTNQTTLISMSINGGWGNGFSDLPCLSADARYIGFNSSSNTLIANDTSPYEDIFVRDRITGQTTRISVNAAGQPANGNSNYCSMAADGNLVAYDSNATNLDGIVTGTYAQSYVYNRQTGETRLISVSSEGEPGNDASGEPIISANGRYVMFLSWANNLVVDDTNNHYDLFVHDLITGQTTRVNVNANGGQTSASCSEHDISANGRFASFACGDSNLVANDTNGEADVFVHDLQTGETRRASVSESGAQGNGDSIDSAISEDGHWVAFASQANNLVPGHTVDTQSDVYQAEMPFYDVGTMPDTVPDRNYFSSLPVTLTWTKLKQAASYEVQVSTSPTFATLEASQSVPANQPRATFDGLANGIHYWRVRGKNSIGVPGAWSAVDSFEVDVVP